MAEAVRRIVHRVVDGESANGKPANMDYREPAVISGVAHVVALSKK
ncbi:hypothetical protein [Arthrobacter sp. OV608]|nr:hypothetical protein [Arthrobacter sp. OV608]